MQNKKNNILIIVILALFGISGAVLYNGFFKSEGVVGSQPDLASAQKEIVNLLPYGQNLNFTKLTERTKTSTTYTYETLNPSNVGVDIHDVISGVTESGAPTQVVGQKR